MKKMLVVVDMVNGFINFGALADKNINKITPGIIKLIEKAKKSKIDIVAFRDSHDVNDKEFEVFPPHCIKGTEESDFIPELKKYEKDMIVIEKNTTNGFLTEEFKKIVSEVEYDEVYVVGCCTDICVENFVASYLQFNNKNNRNTKIYVDKDCCYTFDGEGHDAQLCHDLSVEKMRLMGANIVVNKTFNKR